MDLVAAIFGVVVGGLVSPVNIVAGVVVGWFSRRWWQVVVGAVTVAAVGLLVALPGGVPAGAEVVWVALPFAVVAPLAWAALGFVLRRRLLGPGSVGEKAGSAAVAALIGALAGGALGALLGSWYVDAAGVSSFEGRSGYLVAFFFVLPGVAVGAAVAAVIGWRAMRR